MHRGLGFFYPHPVSRSLQAGGRKIIIEPPHFYIFIFTYEEDIYEK
ncbi:MAG: hypothetical protein DDT22_01047 [candidate division WS2 bacterium]|nr:hypothetical protein [Candidatus Lithacetigena glycinireducens]